MAFLWHIIIIICAWMPGALGYSIVFGRGKILHFGPVASSLASTYAFFLILEATQSYPLAILASLVMTVAFALFFTLLLFRLDNEGFGIFSIAMHLAVLAVVLNWNDLTHGALGLPNIPRAPLPQSLGVLAVVMVIIAVICLISLWLLVRSSFGRALTAFSEQEHVALSLGINRTRLLIITFLVTGIMNLIGSITSTQYFGLLHPNDFQFASVIFYVMLVVAGRPESILGVTLSTALLVILREGIRFVKIPLMTASGLLWSPIPSGILGPTRLILFGVILFVGVWIRRDTLFPKQRSI